MSFEDQPSDTMQTIGETLVRDGSRLDRIAEAHRGCPLIADANADVIEMSEVLQDVSLQHLLVLDGEVLIGLVDVERLRELRRANALRGAS